jgi:choline dehydrogenase-like flavoprotein
VNDPRWNYDGFLPFFIKSEHHHDPSADPTQHGFDGPIHTQTARTTGRDHPLREPTREAFAAIGINEISDANSGSPQGLAQCTEAWNQGKRQLASSVYPLDQAAVLTDTLVKRVVVEEQNGMKTAVGVELADGRLIKARKEIILCAGAYRTPQVLLLSGIGAEEGLSRLGIKQVVDLPDVGMNLHDHFAVSQYWKLRDPDQGLAAGHPKFSNPAYALGLPFDWVATHSVPAEGLKSALAADEGKVNESHAQLNDRSHLELYLVYAGASANPAVPFDGTHVMTSVVMLLPTSRGQVGIASTDPHDNPVIDNNYFATEHDHYIMRTGLKLIGKMLRETSAGQAIVSHEIVADGLNPLSSILSDSDLDARVRFGGK